MPYPVLSSRYVAVRERRMLRRRWKRRVELNNGTSNEDAKGRTETLDVYWLQKSTNACRIRQFYYKHTPE